MRKILIFVLIIILVAVFGATVSSGISIAGLHISSVKGIIEENNELDEEIAYLQQEIDTTYETAKANVESSYKQLLAAKQEYQSAITYSTEEEIQAANQTEEYELSYLWTKIGLYATSNNLTMKAEVSAGSSGVSDQYNITFTIVGEYISISEFIYAIENDSNLGFKIEEFKLSPYSGDDLQATFVIKNIAIDPESITTTQSETVDTTSEETETTEETESTEEVSSEETSEY